MRTYTAILAITAALAGTAVAQEGMRPGAASGNRASGQSGPDTSQSSTGGVGGEQTGSAGASDQKSEPPNGCDPTQADKAGKTQNNASAGCMKP